MQRTDLSSSLTLARRLRYAASALLSFAHWHEGFPTWLTLGDALHEAGELRRALAAYDRAILLAPADVEAHTSRGHVLIDLGLGADAAAAFEAALEHEPGDEDLAAFRNQALDLEQASDAPPPSKGL